MMLIILFPGLIVFLIFLLSMCWDAEKEKTNE